MKSLFVNWFFLSCPRVTFVWFGHLFDDLKQAEEITEGSLRHWRGSNLSGLLRAQDAFLSNKCQIAKLTKILALPTWTHICQSHTGKPYAAANHCSYIHSTLLCYAQVGWFDEHQIEWGRASCVASPFGCHLTCLTANKRPSQLRQTWNFICRK